MLSVIQVLSADLAGAVGYILDAAADAPAGVVVAVARHGRWRGAAVFDLAQPAPAIPGVLGRVGRALGQGGACAVNALFEDERAVVVIAQAVALFLRSPAPVWRLTRYRNRSGLRRYSWGWRLIGCVEIDDGNAGGAELGGKRHRAELALGVVQQVGGLAGGV